MSIVLFLVFILNAFILIGYFYSLFSNKKFKNQRPLSYIVVMIGMYTLYVMGNLYRDYALYESLMVSVVMAVESFVFKINFDAIRLYLFEDTFYRVTFIFGYLVAIMTSISILLDFVLLKTKNNLRYWLHRKKFTQVIIGIDEYSIQYHLNEKDTSIFWPLNDDEIQYLVRHRLQFIQKKVCTQSINKFCQLREITHFISFKVNEDDNIKVINLLESVQNKIAYHIMTNVDNYPIYEQYKTDKMEIHLFSLHDVLSKQLHMQHPLSKYIPQKHLNNAKLQDAQVHVHLLGFGDTNQRNFYNAMINNQFIKIDRNVPTSNPVEYWLYDKNAAIFDKHVIYPIHSEYVDITHKVSTKVLDFEGIGVRNLIENLDSKDSSIHFFYIAYGSDVQNLKTAIEILNTMEDSNSFHIFSRVKTKHNYVLNDKITTFGSFDEILNAHNILRLHIDDLAIKKAYEYAKPGVDIKDYWMSLDEFTKESNRAMVMNFPFKQGLLSAIENPTTSLNEEIYRNLSYQEHLRWNAFHIMNGFKVMPLKDIYIQENKTINKNIKLKIHACIRNFEGLYDYQETVKRLWIDQGLAEDKAKEKADIIKYDDEVIQLLIRKFKAEL